MSSLIQLLKKSNERSNSGKKPQSEMLPTECPLTPAIFNISIKLKIEGRVGTTLIMDYLSLVVLALSHDILLDRPDMALAIPYLWKGIMNTLSRCTVVHQVTECITEMVISEIKVNAFSEGSIVPTGTKPYSAVGTRTWELQSSDDSLLVTVLTYDIFIKPGAHHMRSQLRSTGHVLFHFPTQNDSKLFKDLQKWQSIKNKTHSQVVEYLLAKHLNHKTSTLTTIIDHHEELVTPDTIEIKAPSAPPLYE